MAIILHPLDKFISKNGVCEIETLKNITLGQFQKIDLL